MKSVLKGAIFDWDGTLLDIDEREFYCINRALAAHGAKAIDREFFIRNYYCRPFDLGTGPGMVLDAALGGEGAKVEVVYSTYRRFFAETIDRARLQEGASQLLATLKRRGFKIGIATMRFTRSVVASELKLLGLNPMADVLLTREDLGMGQTLESPDETVEKRARLVLRALKHLGLQPREAFLVGDSWWDIRAGKQLGMKTVLILTGFSSYSDFSSEKPDLIVRSLHELEAQLEEHKWLDPSA